MLGEKDTMETVEGGFCTAEDSILSAPMDVPVLKDSDPTISAPRDSRSNNDNISAPSDVEDIMPGEKDTIETVEGCFCTAEDSILSAPMDSPFLKDSDHTISALGDNRSINDSAPYISAPSDVKDIMPGEKDTMKIVEGGFCTAEDSILSAPMEGQFLNWLTDSNPTTSAPRDGHSNNDTVSNISALLDVEGVSYNYPKYSADINRQRQGFEHNRTVTAPNNNANNTKFSSKSYWTSHQPQ